MFRNASKNLSLFLYYSRAIRRVTAAVDSKNMIKTSVGISECSAKFTIRKKSQLSDKDAAVGPALDALLRDSIADSKNNAFVTEYGPTLKVMPLGDSITYGIIGKNNKNSGGYRTLLWNKFVADGLQVKFVGSQVSGPDELSNKHHEGHPGWTINQIAASVNRWLDRYQPDLILLMIGTNDTQNSLKTMLNEFSALIDKITTHSPDVQLLVASIPPVHPTVNSSIRVLRATYFNTAIPSIIEAKVAQGKKVDFVDMRSLTVDDLTSSLSHELDVGVHPNPQGYHKIANFWHDAVYKVMINNQRVILS